MSTNYAKPLPLGDYDSQEFWDGAKRHELLAQRCDQCKRFRHPPQAHCANCGSKESTWTKMSGKGKVYTYILITHTVLPQFAEDVPYNVTQVALDEQDDVILTTNLVDVRNEDIHAGMPVEVIFDDVTSEHTLPKFRPVSG